MDQGMAARIWYQLKETFLDFVPLSVHKIVILQEKLKNITYIYIKI